MQTGVIAMTDIPVFTAADGIATLILHEIPARKEGYILVRAVFGSLVGLLRECADFCRGAGAERIYAGGEADFSDYPVFARLMERRLRRAGRSFTTPVFPAFPPRRAAAHMRRSV